ARNPSNCGIFFRSSLTPMNVTDFGKRHKTIRHRTSDLMAELKISLAQKCFSHAWIRNSTADFSILAFFCG
ncbi:MAG TPA: hypothetical protein DDW21_10135, partial [Verrucomicrobiales bacterium]|nr:hypothetical protein [Verrucomicrobiales bacterium]